MGFRTWGAHQRDDHRGLSVHHAAQHRPVDDGPLKVRGAGGSGVFDANRGDAMSSAVIPCGPASAATKQAKVLRPPWRLRGQWCRGGRYRRSVRTRRRCARRGARAFPADGTGDVEGGGRSPSTFPMNVSHGIDSNAANGGSTSTLQTRASTSSAAATLSVTCSGSRISARAVRALPPHTSSAASVSRR